VLDENDEVIDLKQDFDSDGSDFVPAEVGEVVNDAEGAEGYSTKEFDELNDEVGNSDSSDAEDDDDAFMSAAAFDDDDDFGDLGGLGAFFSDDSIDF
jgi:hypothetical protein